MRARSCHTVLTCRWSYPIATRSKGFWTPRACVAGHWPRARAGGHEQRWSQRPPTPRRTTTAPARPHQGACARPAARRGRRVAWCALGTGKSTPTPRARTPSCPSTCAPHPNGWGYRALMLQLLLKAPPKGCRAPFAQTHGGGGGLNPGPCDPSPPPPICQTLWAAGGD